MRGLKYRLQGLIIKDTMKYIVVFATKECLRRKNLKFLLTGRGEQKLAVNLQNLRGFDFYFIF